MFFFFIMKSYKNAIILKNNLIESQKINNLQFNSYLPFNYFSIHIMEYI